MLKMLASGALAAGCAILWMPPLGAAEEQPSRFAMSPTEGGFVRLDRDTGVMSICTGKEGDWACKPIPDREQSLQARISQLESENQSLRSGAVPPTAVPPPAAAIPPASTPPPIADAPPAPPGNLKLPNEQDVDQVFDYVEGMMKKFKERIKRLEREAQKEPDTSL